MRCVFASNPFAKAMTDGVADSSVAFLAMAMERLTALETNVDSLQAQLEIKSTRFDAYKSAMPQPLGYYIELDHLPWTSPEDRAERLLYTRRAVLEAVGGSLRRLEEETQVRVFLGKSHQMPVCIIFYRMR